ncbi:RNA polymerase sigma-70 factor, ECF subfamily [Chitinophaga terrae (ex Kim and Jung 2007)]|jgi:RNA polymerase sigma-70 factor (ECF subfamily)|uniref:RNA polymerase sigma-70 factor, ECF subfamily n=1 Tax=Chitinophaga terrae (ex Kim and Jung 2007) TaxID=408074 RepID=A0A1H4AXD5_9BACT|nr:sigma-70 family RNA polymerase sigma factor [Chitinophaga terrae (ex Kim and Jung 2007)]MDQ0106815.1 RNA polymerase sigma-70 factor (ECF subfamily) [Chitinophaga terrae (ex Kim and Jung 2007)]GEP89087.1 DNA-directed RNA polymerase sigma-70 factor [Chitinophaga terrae (ex Kim and Jung 2007)]SEA40494.1 RNA polymerase sigma-70 factor, ECF subfamily [Chitinophaga terrae (ex Kim and Jung 2007)]
MYNQTYTDKELLHLLAQDSEYAFTVIFDRYRGKVLGTAMRMLKSTSAAEEVVQEIFMKVWAKRRELESVTHLQSFIATMTRNLLFDRFKKLAHEAAYLDSLVHLKPVINDTDHRVRTSFAHKLLQHAIDRLPPRQKQVYEMVRVQGLSIDEVSDTLSISRNTAKSHLTAALQAIQKHLRTHPDTFVCLVSINVLTMVFQQS